MENYNHPLIIYFSKNVLIDSKYNILFEDNNVVHIKSLIIS
jgi:hypothetical protein